MRWRRYLRLTESISYLIENCLLDRSQYILMDSLFEVIDSNESTQDPSPESEIATGASENDMEHDFERSRSQSWINDSSNVESASKYKSQIMNLEREWVQINTFMESLFDVLMTLQNEVIEKRQLESTELEKAIGRLREEIQELSVSTKNGYDSVKVYLEEHDSILKELKEKEMERSLQIAELSNMMKIAFQRQGHAL